jgi:hypothetical protein
MQYIAEPKNREVFNIYIFMKPANATQRPVAASAPLTIDNRQCESREVMRVQNV